MFLNAKTLLKAKLPRPIYESMRLFKNPGDVASALQFASRTNLGVPLASRLDVLINAFRTTFKVDCPHTQREVLAFIQAILERPVHVRGCVVEAGCYKGGSTAKFSLAARLAGRKLFVFDSFEGIPNNDEVHGRNIFGDEAQFPPGSYAGSLDEVRATVARYGALEVCTFVKGWFDDTLPAFQEPIAAAYIDVDLASSTRTCIKYLYPLLEPGGVIFSQDGHLPLVLEVFEDEAFWNEEVGCPKPRVTGLGKSKLLRIDKR